MELNLINPSQNNTLFDISFKGGTKSRSGSGSGSRSRSRSRSRSKSGSRSRSERKSRSRSRSRSRSGRRSRSSSGRRSRSDKELPKRKSRSRSRKSVKKGEPKDVGECSAEQHVEESPNQFLTDEPSVTQLQEVGKTPDRECTSLSEIRKNIEEAKEWLFRTCQNTQYVKESGHASKSAPYHPHPRDSTDRVIPNNAWSNLDDKRFYQWLESRFNKPKYVTENNPSIDPCKCKTCGKTKKTGPWRGDFCKCVEDHNKGFMMAYREFLMNFGFPHQKFVSDYFNSDSPYRGLLVYHGLGSFKDESTIEIKAEEIE